MLGQLLSTFRCKTKFLLFIAMIPARFNLAPAMQATRQIVGQLSYHATISKTDILKGIMCVCVYSNILSGGGAPSLAPAYS